MDPQDQLFPAETAETPAQSEAALPAPAVAETHADGGYPIWWWWQ